MARLHVQSLRFALAWAISAWALCHTGPPLFAQTPTQDGGTLSAVDGGTFAGRMRESVPDHELPNVLADISRLQSIIATDASWVEAWRLHLEGKRAELSQAISTINTANSEQLIRDFDGRCNDWGHAVSAWDNSPGSFAEASQLPRFYSGFATYVLSPQYEQLRAEMANTYPLVSAASQSFGADGCFRAQETRRAIEYRSQAYPVPLQAQEPSQWLSEAGLAATIAAYREGLDGMIRDVEAALQALGSMQSRFSSTQALLSLLASEAYAASTEYQRKAGLNGEITTAALFFFGCLIFFLGPVVYGVYLLRLEQMGTKEFPKPFPSLQLATVGLLIGTILILGLNGLIESDLLATLLGAISGYVLSPGSRQMMRGRGESDASGQAVADPPQPPRPLRSTGHSGTAIPVSSAIVSHGNGQTPPGVDASPASSSAGPTAHAANGSTASVAGPLIVPSTGQAGSAPSGVSATPGTSVGHAAGGGAVKNEAAEQSSSAGQSSGSAKPDGK